MIFKGVLRCFLVRVLQSTGGLLTVSAPAMVFSIGCPAPSNAVDRWVNAAIW
jgi:hypothetical protein